MTWTFSAHIPLAAIADRPTTHAWNDRDPLFYYREDRRLENKLAKVSIRGVLALAADSAEWIAARWPTLAASSLVPALEAMWLSIADGSELPALATAAFAPNPADIHGPEHGPIGGAYYSLANIADRARRSASTVARCVELAQLARHVLPDPEPFQTWFRAAVAHMQTRFARSQADPFGPVIPRTMQR